MERNTGIAFGVSIEAFFYGRLPSMWPSIECAVCTVMGLQLGVEVWPVRGLHDKYRLTPSEIERLNGICRRAPFVSMHSQYSLWTWDPPSLMHEISLCGKLGGSGLVLHRETFGLSQVGDPVRVDEIAEIAAYARQQDVLLLLENSPNGMWALDRILEQLGDDPENTNIGICIDVGHAYVSTDAGRQPIRDYTKRYSSQLSHVHFSDNKGDQDEHLLPGEGTIDWVQVFALLADVGYVGPCVIELHPTGEVCRAIDSTIKFLYASKLQSGSLGA